MGTRGFITFVVNGDEKTTYNHFDSYPDGLGTTMLEFVSGITDLAAVKAQAAALQMVSDKVRPTAEQIAALRQYSWNAAQHGGGQDLRDGQQWYDLLHETQGKPARILKAGFAEDSREFPLDSLYAEWGYVVDFDEGVFEVYQGFQHEPHSLGRFADRTPLREYNTPGVGPYYPVALAAGWKLDNLPDKGQFLSGCQDDDDA